MLGLFSMTDRHPMKMKRAEPKISTIHGCAYCSYQDTRYLSAVLGSFTLTSCRSILHIGVCHREKDRNAGGRGPQTETPIPSLETSLEPLPRQQTHLARHLFQKVRARATRSCPGCPGLRSLISRTDWSARLCAFKGLGTFTKGVQKAIKPGWEVAQKSKLFFSNLNRARATWDQ